MKITMLLTMLIIGCVIIVGAAFYFSAYSDNTAPTPVTSATSDPVVPDMKGVAPVTEPAPATGLGTVPYVYTVLPSDVALDAPAVHQLFSILATARDDYNASTDVPGYRQALGLDIYCYQLAATVNSLGETEVRVYALPLGLQNDPQWATAPLVTRDGGQAYFDTTVNLATGASSHFSVHGES